MRAEGGALPCRQDQGGSSGLLPNAFQMHPLNERGGKKKEASEMPVLKERKNEGKSTHTSAADFTV